LGGLKDIVFRDRVEAGERLATALDGRVGADALVLGIPRGGVVVAKAVARALGATLDVVVPHKLGAPWNSELAVGAVTHDGTVVLDQHIVAALHISESYLEQEIERQRAEIDRRLTAYRGAPEEPDPKDRTCVVVDDGMATGATADAAMRSLKARGAARALLAVPVASRQAVERLEAVADEVLCLEQPEPFFAVGQWFDHFGQVTDEEVLEAMGRSVRR
jgi:putative phosphoribosyl transferase